MVCLGVPKIQISLPSHFQAFFISPGRSLNPSCPDPTSPCHTPPVPRPRPGSFPGSPICPTPLLPPQSSLSQGVASRSPHHKPVTTIFTFARSCSNIARYIAPSPGSYIHKFCMFYFSGNIGLRFFKIFPIFFLSRLLSPPSFSLFIISCLKGLLRILQLVLISCLFSRGHFLFHPQPADCWVHVRSFLTPNLQHFSF